LTNQKQKDKLNLMKQIFFKAKPFLVILLVSFLVVFAPSKTRGQEPSPAGPRWDVSKICEQVGIRIDWHLERYEERRDDFVERVNRARERLKDINQKLKDQGCDTSQLEADYQSLGSQLSVWVNDYNVFVNLLNESKTLACGESQGAYKDKVNQARNQLITVREKGMEMKNFYSETIRPDVEALKATCFPSEE